MKRDPFGEVAEADPLAVANPMKISEPTGTFGG